ncbi:KLHL8 [Symbiodinium microadriaticum]|nr:KLHL8 [Symbiodinium microadriaticum]
MVQVEDSIEILFGEKKELLELPGLARALGLAAGLRAAQRFASCGRSHGASMRQMLPRLCEEVRPQFFVVGGCLAGAELSCLQHYDPWQNAWDIRQPMPTERRWCSGAQCMGKIYVIGGQQEGHVLGTVERYDVEMDLWEPVPDMPTPREACGVASCGSCLYVFGGCQHEEALSVTERLNVSTSLWWEGLEDMPCRRDACAAASVASRLFVVGGRWRDFLSTADMLHVQSNRWSPLPPMPTPRLGCSAAAFGKSVFVFGGHAGRGRALATVERLDIAAFVWEIVADMPTPRLGCVSLCYNRPVANTLSIYVFGGHNGHGAVAMAECLDVADSGDVLGWRVLPFLPTPSYACAGSVSLC